MLELQPFRTWMAADRFGPSFAKAMEGRQLGPEKLEGFNRL